MCARVVIFCGVLFVLKLELKWHNLMNYIRWRRRIVLICFLLNSLSLAVVKFWIKIWKMVMENL